MLGTGMTDIAVAPPTEEHSQIPQQAGLLDFTMGRPAGGTVGGDQSGLPGAPDGTGDGG